MTHAPATTLVPVQDVLDGRARPTEHDGLPVVRWRVRGERLFLDLETGVDVRGPISNLTVALDATDTVQGEPA